MKFQNIIIALLLAAIAGTAYSASIPKGKENITFKSKTGTVTFHHKRHADLSFTKCTTCHHTWDGKEKMKPCKECHKKSDSVMAPKKKTAFHTRCSGCHEYTVSQGKKAGPQPKQCKLCHIK